jgi:hypothetical protein
VLLALLGVTVWAAIASSGAKQRRNSTLERLATELKGHHDSNSAYGMLDGVVVTYRFETRGSGSSAERWTEVDAQIPHAYPLELHVRRHGRRDRRLIAWGEMIDVEVGDPAFDPMFLVEAAPSDVVRILLDAEARAFLASRSSSELDTLQREDGTRALRLATSGWTEDVAAATTQLRAVARLASRIRDAFEIADHAHAPTDRGSPYRPALDDSPAREAAATRAKEIDDLRAVQRRRAQSTAALASAIGWIMFGVSLSWLLGATMCR